ncbi:class I SAM-dependent methyltransferase [Paludifilum halophilum]|uniref:SAM-dependent methyltransferase n=1 Tax=Paludifilum halophilum TaxID=1642702 RepID=A0A235B781_9BACL|nr:class I SAM-dependent methyltransferase [Paludifilum halophilum]OYD08154.1 SAM-dependent methyltransferase [Paludifilum halophilum]
MTDSLENPHSMSYVDLLSYIEEVNRCPGGKRTVNNILMRSLLQDGAKVLEIGCNTGFTSIEVAKMKNCQLFGIDVNPQAIQKANEILKKEPDFIQERVKFEVGDARNIRFKDNQFDLVITGGANTFIPEKDRELAFAEYQRVLKPYGLLSVTNLFYHRDVPKPLLQKLNDILGFEIQPWTKNYWLDLLLQSGMELYWYQEKEMQARPSNVIKTYTNGLINQSPALKSLDDKQVQEFKSRWLEIMEVFNENHRYLSFMTALLRNQFVPEQQELFLEKGVIDPWNLNGPKLWKEE